MILPSATIISPASNNTMSPGTMSFDGISIFPPFRITFAQGEDNSLMASRDFSAFTCCTVPSNAFITSTAKITIVLSIFPEIIEIMAAIIKIITNKSQNWCKNTESTLCFFASAKTFSPLSERICFTASLLSPSVVT